MNDLIDVSVTKIPIETKHGLYTVSSADIVMVEAHERKVIVYTVDNMYQAVQKMQYWIDVLQISGFFQTHRSYIVNMKYVSHFDHSLVYLCGGEFCAYLTRRKYSGFKKLYLDYLK